MALVDQKIVFVLNMPINNTFLLKTKLIRVEKCFKRFIFMTESKLLKMIST